MTLRDQLVRHEGGCKTTPYMDCCGKRRVECACAIPGHLTIGVGHNLDVNPIDADLLMSLFDRKRMAVENEVLSEFPWAKDLHEPRYAVIVNMAYNMGVGGVMEFHRMIDAIGQQDWARAAAEMRNSTWYRQVGARGEELARQMETDSWGETQ